MDKTTYKRSIKPPLSYENIQNEIKKEKLLGVEKKNLNLLK